MLPKLAGRCLRPLARSVLTAAAFTYVAGALAALIDVARWVRVLRF
jgi:Zn-dependent membrane protease YugP